MSTIHWILSQLFYIFDLAFWALVVNDLLQKYFKMSKETRIWISFVSRTLAAPGLFTAMLILSAYPPWFKSLKAKIEKANEEERKKYGF